MQIRDSSAAREEQPAVRRLSALAPLGAADIAALGEAMAHPRIYSPRRELIAEGHPIAGPTLILSGWAARQRILPDGRRQFLSFLLPGDLIGMCYQREPLAVSTVTALTAVTTCPAPQGIPGLDEAYRVSRALEEAYLLSHIVRLGRLDAEERIGDLLLELHERLSLAGLASREGFDIALTQEMLGDALGLTSVHVNRMLQLLRGAGEVVWKGSHVALPHPGALARKAGRTPIRVSGALG